MKLLKEMVDRFGLPLLEQESATPLDRAAFVYLEPKDKQDPESFAQCASCPHWTTQTCYLHSKEVEVSGDSTCELYVHGEPNKELAGKELGAVTPKESGLVHAQVQCHRCVSFDDGVCLLFKTLNEKMPEKFKLQESVHEHGCCNAWASTR